MPRWLSWSMQIPSGHKVCRHVQIIQHHYPWHASVAVALRLSAAHLCTLLAIWTATSCLLRWLQSLVLRLPETFHKSQCCADAFTFLQPFSWELWVCLVLFVFGVALVLTVLARLSPMGLFDIRKVAVHVKGTSGDVTRQYAIHDGTPEAPQHCIVNSLALSAVCEEWAIETSQSRHFPPHGMLSRHRRSLCTIGAYKCLH